MGEYPKCSELAIGNFVEIAMYHQNNRKVKGEIESILTHAETHPHGIMVTLTNKKIGRVQRKLSPPAKIPIDLDAAKKKNIVVTNTPDVLTDATTEIAILVLLGAARRAKEGMEWAKKKIGNGQLIF